MVYWKFYNLLKIDWEDPLEIWKKYGRKYFIRPKIKIGFAPRNYHDENPAKLLEVYGVGLGWKTKYGELEYESDPYIEVTLAGCITFHVNFVAPDYDKKEMFDVCYWEGILSMMDNVDAITNKPKKSEEDALYDAYTNNQWVQNYSKENEYTQTIRPFLKPLASLMLNIKIREAQVKEARENGTLNHNHW